MKLSRLLVTCLMALSPLAAQAEVEQFKIMAPANAGGGFDTIARTLGEALQASGQRRRHHRHGTVHQHG